jgi:16S rRNA processing protein RimM
MEKVTLGQIVNVVGLQGELKIKSLSHFSNLRYQKTAAVYIEKQGAMVPFKVKKHRQQDGLDFVMFEGIDNRSAAETLKGLYIFADKEAIQLAKDFFFFGDLVGCEVFTTSNQPVGKVVRVEEFGTQSHLRIQRENKPSLLIPFLNVFIQHVDIQKKQIVVDLWDGMQ